MLGLLLLPIILVVGDLPCQQRDFGHTSHVCVCNRSVCLYGCNICLLACFFWPDIGFFSTYCDEYDPVEAVDGQILHYVSDRVFK